MMKKRLSKTLWYGSDIDKEGKPVLPPLAEEANDLEGIHEGELYLHIGDGLALLFTRSADGQVVQLGSNADELANYLLKSVWDKAFEFRTTENGEEYLFAKLNLATQFGITMYANGGLLDLPSIFEGIPFDNKTIWLNPETKVVEVIGSTEEDEGGADFSNVNTSGEGNAFTSFVLSEDGKELTFVKGETFAKQSDYEALNTKVTDFLEGSDTDNIINKWKELEAFLSGMKESDELSDILSEKADWGTTLAHYGITDAYTKTAVDGLLEDKADTATTLAGYGITNAYTKTQVDNLIGDFVTSDDVETLLEDYLPLTGGTITGNLRLRKGSEYTSPYLYFGGSDEVWMKEATDTHLTIHADGSVNIDSPKTIIDGIEIKKLASGALFIDANVVVSGGVSMYGTDGTAANTIWDDAPIASTSVKGIASFDSKYFAVNNGKVTFIGSTGGGGGIDSITKQMVIDVLGFTPYDEDNPDGFITGITKSMVTTALGYTPYNSTNPNGYITGITKSMVTTALGFTPYNATNPNGYVTSSGSVAYATSAGSASKDGNGNVIAETYFPLTGGYISGDIIPDASKSYCLGNSDYIWDEVYARYVNLGNTGEIYLYGTSDTLDIVTNSELRIKQGTTVPFYMDEYGNFGIWTTAPEATFHVNGDVQIDKGLKLWNNTYLSFFNSDLETTMSVLYVNRYNNLRIGKGISDEGYNTEIYGNEIYMGTETLYGDNWLLVDSSKGLGLKFIYDDDWYIQINLNDGNMYIGAGSANSLMIDNVGNLLIPEGATMHGTSDRRLKKNIRSFSASNVLMSLGGVYKFEYTENEVERNPLHSGTHIGLIYQDVKGTDLERMCHERVDGYGTLNYLDSSFISLLAGVGMEHETRIQELEKENRELRKEIEKLKAA